MQCCAGGGVRGAVFAAGRYHKCGVRDAVWSAGPGAVFAAGRYHDEAMLRAKWRPQLPIGEPGAPSLKAVW